MGYEVEQLHKDRLSQPTVLGDSAHVVTRYQILAPSPDMPSTVYVKAYPDLKSIEEEVTFSALYRLDIGRHAAKSVSLVDNDRVAGLASYALPQFVDYHQLFSRKHKALREKVFHCDKFGRPKSIKLTKGLAKILMSAWLNGEDDLHRRNIGIAVDEQGEPYWARLDFGMSFSSITQSIRPLRPDIGRYNAITLTGLQQFPELGAYAPFYWPTSITYKNNAFNFRGRQKGNAYDGSDKLYFNGLQDSVGDEASLDFQIEKNDFLYQLFLVDIEEKKKIIVANVSDKKYANRLATQIENRILTMRWTALCEPGFQAYVKKMESDKKAGILADIECNYKLLNLECDTVSINARMRELQSQVELVRTSPKKCIALSECIQAIFRLDIEMEGLLAKEPIDTRSLEVKQLDLFKKQASLLNHYLQEGKTHEGLKQLNFVMYRRNALAPITQLVPRLENYPGLAYFFKEFRRKRVIPSLEKLDGMRSDAIYQHELPERLRHIDTLMSRFIDSGQLEVINDLLPQIDFSKPNVSIDVAIDEAKRIEKALLICQFKDTLSLFDGKLSQQDNHHNTMVMVSATKYMKRIKDICLVPYLAYCQDMRMSPAEIQKSPLLASCFQVQRLFDDILTSDLIKSNEEAAIFDRDMSRIKDIIEKYQLETELQSIRFEKCQLERLTQAFQEIELVITRLALDLKIEKMNQTSKKTPFMRELLAASFQLSKALSKPEYHDIFEIQAVSHAGYLGAKALASPTLENAKRCIEHARQLTNSHQRRTKTKVAFALALLGAVVVIGAIAALCWPASIGVAASLAAWCAFGTGSGLTLLSGNYAVRRFFRDQDKVKRKLEDVGECTLSYMPSPTVL